MIYCLIHIYNTHTHTAVVCWGVGDEGKVEEIEVQPPTGNQVRIKMLFASICHSDHLLGAQGFPLVRASLITGSVYIYICSA